MEWIKWAVGFALFVGGIVLASTVSPVLGVPILVIGGVIALASKVAGVGHLGSD